MNLEDRMHMELIDLNNVRSFKDRGVLRIGDFNSDEMAYIPEVARLMGNSFMDNRQDLSKIQIFSLHHFCFMF